MTPEVLPDGSLLLYRLNPQRNLQLFRFWPETGRLQDLPVVSRVLLSSPQVHIRATPDGREAVVAGTPVGQEKEPDRLLAVDVSTGASRPLTPPGVTLEGNAAAVTRDGKSVVAALRGDALRRVVSLPMKGLPAREIPRTLFTTTATRIWYLDTDSDGRVYISATDLHGEAIRYSATPSSPTTTGSDLIAGHSNIDGQSILSLPDGRAIVTMRGLGRDRLMALADGNEPSTAGGHDGGRLRSRMIAARTRRNCVPDRTGPARDHRGGRSRHGPYHQQDRAGQGGDFVDRFFPRRKNVVLFRRWEDLVRSVLGGRAQSHPLR